jgi:hypothetical protein
MLELIAGENARIELTLRDSGNGVLAASLVKSIALELVQRELVKLSYTYTAGAASNPSNLVLTDGLLVAELLPADTAGLLYDYALRVRFSYLDADYIGSGAQTDVTCAEDAIRVSKCEEVC